MATGQLLFLIQLEPTHTAQNKVNWYQMNNGTEINCKEKFFPHDLFLSKKLLIYAMQMKFSLYFNQSKKKDNISQTDGDTGEKNCF